MSFHGLSSDQRWLLRQVGTVHALDALISPEGTKRYMQSCAGGAGMTPPPGAPDWMTSYETRSGKIVSPATYCGEVRVVVTAAQINGFGACLSDDIRAEVEQSRQAQRHEHDRTWHWCRCPWKDQAPNAHSGPCTRYHPTAAEDDEHFARLHAIHDWQARLLARALDLDAGQQLALFDSPA
jgi:hypothetical protein